MTIMNCDDCGTGLREWDFHRKRARLVENRPYCSDCRPAIGAGGEPVFNRTPRVQPNGARTLPTNQDLRS